MLFGPRVEVTALNRSLVLRGADKNIVDTACGRAGPQLRPLRKTLSIGVRNAFLLRLLRGWLGGLKE